MSSFSWSSFSLRIPVQASVQKLYWCMATQQGLEYWFLRSSQFLSENDVRLQPGVYVSVGDSYTWLWHGWTDEVVEHGSILSTNHKDELAFSFGLAGNVSIRLVPSDGYTMVELVQDQIPDNEMGRHHWHLGCKTGWIFYLTNLKSLLEGGIDLRNKDATILQVLNA